MSRIALAAVVVALGFAVATVATAQNVGTYEHVWLAQGMVGGDLGGRLLQAVDDSTVTLDDDGSGVWAGAVSYADRVGVEDAVGRVFGQVTEIELELTGVDVVADESAGGTFTGVIRQRVYTVAEAADVLALDFPQGREPAQDVSYDVSGSWGALLTGGDVIGEVIYELAVAPGSDMETARRLAAEFNRASTLDPDALGEAQAFAIRAPDDEPIDPGGSDDPGGDDGGDGGEEAESPGLLDYVVAGLSPGEASEMPVHPDLERPARALKDAAPVGATPMPDGAVAIDVDLSGAYLDAKNRAAGLLTHGGPTDDVGALEASWRAGREATVLPVAPGDEDGVSYYAERLLDTLSGQDRVEGALSLAADVRVLLGRPDIDALGGSTGLKRWWHVASATGATAPSADVVEGTWGVTSLVIDRAIPHSGPAADAVLVWAGHATAPTDARSVRGFEPDPSRDASAVASESGIVGRALARHGDGSSPAGLIWMRGGEARSAAPPVWLAVAAPSGRVAWLAGPPGSAEVALTDAAVRGYAFSRERVWLVDADDLGSVVAVYDLE